MSNSAPRETVLVSHANPEDNEVALWFARKLRLAGYQVFLDLWLPAGADFWMEIERALRDDTVRMLFLASRSSNVKPGTLQELSLAQTIGRKLNDPHFIVPLLIDDLPFSDLNIQLTRLNVVPSRNWALGLRTAIEALELAKVPTESAVPRRDQLFPPVACVSTTGEDYLSNWFRLGTMPSLYRYRMATGVRAPVPAEATAVDWVAKGDYLYSFASEDELAGVGFPTDRIAAIELTDLSILGDDVRPGTSDYRIMSDALQELMGRAFARHCRSRGLVEYGLAARRSCFYFPTGLTDRDKVWFPTSDGRTSYRQLAGQRLKVGTVRHWHFAISGRLRFSPQPFLVVDGHVVFSDDGRIAWGDPRRQHRARRALCRTWWNEEWRDRVLAMMQFVGDEESEIHIAASPAKTIPVSCRPALFESPVSYVHVDGAHL
ncbi:MAG: toll/interleukin-1 receptor domain-containing protein [Thermoflexaceae bacterium]|nr:toll/interleukin-1 receptor domain-containing protein [Thermoflexaceae bacterium]